MERVAGRGGRPLNPDETDVEAVTRCVDLLQVASTRARLYGEAHPQTSIAIDSFAEQFGLLAGWLGPIRLDTSGMGFSWRGNPVSTESDEKSGIGRHAHIEGISSLTISPGLSKPEIEQLLSVLRINLSLPLFEEETLESLLWQSELPTITFRAISELMEAEALSGRDEEAGRFETVARDLVHLRPGDLEQGRRFAAALSPDDVRGGDIVDHWGLEAEIDLEQMGDDEWRERFAEEAGEDYEAILAIRDFVRTERSSSILSRLALILIRCVIHGRREVGQEKGANMAKGAIRQIYANGDPFGLLEVIEEGHSIAESLRDTRPDITDWLRKFLRAVYSPLRAARMLRILDPDDPVDAKTLGRFLDILPATSLIALFEGVAKSEDPAQSQRLLAHIIGHIPAKVGGWLQKAENLPHDQLVPIIQALRISRDSGFDEWRPHLLRNPAPAAREAVLSWYEATGMPVEDEGLVAAALVDRSPLVRTAARRALQVHRPPQALLLIKRTLLGDGFAKLDEERKVELCETYGSLAGQGGLTVLTELLSTRAGLLGGDMERSTIHAAALGLAMMGTSNALRTLEKGARGFGGARKASCQFALGVIEQRRHIDESNDNQ